MKLLPAILFIFLGSFLFSSQTLWSQSPINIKANDFVTTTIFFPSNIDKVVEPGANFQFTYDKGSNIGLLKGKIGKASNLLVITEQGYVYSFALSYAEEVIDFNFILTTEQAITRNKSNANGADQNSGKTNAPNQNDSPQTDNTKNQEPTENQETKDDSDKQVKMTNTSDTLSLQKDTTPPQSSDTENSTNGQDDLYDVDREEYYGIFCKNNYLQKTIFKRSFRQNKKIALRLNNILVDRNEKYFVLQIENNSKRDYNVAGLSFFRKSNVGQLEKIMNPLFTFNLQESIDPGSINEVVYVFKNFDISSKEKVMAVLVDADSENMVILPLDDLLINSPSN